MAPMESASGGGRRRQMAGTLVGLDTQVDLDTGFGSRATWIGSDGLAGEYSAVAGDGSKSAETRTAAACFQRAEDHYEQGQTEEAITLAAEAAAQFKVERNLSAAADAVRLQIHAHRLKAEATFSSLQEAQKIADKELADFQKSQSRAGEAALLLSQVELAESEDTLPSSNALAEVIAKAERARDLAKEAKDPKKEALCLVALADLHLRPGLTEDAVQKALESAEAGLKLSQAAQYQVGEAKCYHAMGVGKALGEETAGIRRGYREGLLNIREALDIYEELGRPRSAVNERHTLAQLAMRKKEYREAMSHAKSAFDAVKGVSDASCLWLAAVAKTLVMCYGLCDELDKAVEQAKQMVSLFQEQAAFSAGEAVAQEMLAQAYFFKAEVATGEAQEEDGTEDEKPLAKALLAAQEARLHYENLENAGAKANEAKLFLKIAQIESAQEDHHKALASAEKAQSIAQEISSSELEGIALQVQVKALHDGNDLKAAMGKATECMNLYQDQGLQPQAGLAMLNCSMLHALQGETEEAVDMALKAQEGFKRTKNVAQEIDSLRLLVELQAYSKQPEQAIKYAMKALNISREIGCREDEVQILLRLVHLYLDQEAAQLNEGLDAARFDVQASKYLKEAGIAASRLESKPLLGAVAHTRGYVHLTAGRFQEALQAATQALALFKSLGDAQGEGNTWLLVAEVHFHNDKKEKAKDVANKALATFANLPGLRGREGEAQATEILAKCQQSQMYVLASPEEAARMAAPVDGGQALAVSSAGASQEVSKALEPGFVRGAIADIVNEVIGVDDISDDAPLMEAGMDSLSSLDFRSKLKGTFQGANLPASVIFDYPTVGALTNLIVEESQK